MTSPPGNSHRFAQVAREFCRLVETLPRQDPQEWLGQIAAVLHPLEEAAKDLVTEVEAGAYPMLADLEKRHRMFLQLKSFLTPIDDYWSEFDLEAGDGLMTGSIADDVTEIYFALKRGLDLWPLDEEHALQEWASSYEYHWRRHLVNLMAQAKTKVRYH